MILMFFKALFPALYVLLRFVISIISLVSLNYRIAAAQARNPYHSIPFFPLLNFSNCSGRLIFLTEEAGQEASDVHPMWKTVQKQSYKQA